MIGRLLSAVVAFASRNVNIYFYTFYILNLYLTGVFVKDRKYVLFYEKFCMLENLHALIFDEKDFKELLEDHRKYLEEDIRKGRADILPV
jgi:hypothetical protein